MKQENEAGIENTDICIPDATSMPFSGTFLRGMADCYISDALSAAVKED